MDAEGGFIKSYNTDTWHTRGSCLPLVPLSAPSFLLDSPDTATVSLRTFVHQFLVPGMMQVSPALKGQGWDEGSHIKCKFHGVDL